MKISLDDSIKIKIVHFIAGRRDRGDMREIADAILSSGDASSQAMIDIYIHHDLPIKKMSLLLYQGLDELGLLYIDNVQKATLYLINTIVYQMIQKESRYYDGFCQIRDILRDYNELTNYDGYFGASISPALGELLWEFDLDEDIYSSETPDGTIFEERLNRIFPSKCLQSPCFRGLLKKLVTTMLSKSHSMGL